MRKFTNTESNNGELATRGLSEKAQYFYNNTDPLNVYEVRVYPDELENELIDYEKRYYVRGTEEMDDLSFDELNATFEELYDAYEMGVTDEDDENI